MIYLYKKEKRHFNRAYSLAETLLAIGLVAIFVAFTASVFTKKVSPAKVLPHGKFECYKNAYDELSQKIYSADGNLSSESKDIAECEFIVPENAEMFSIEVIGAGGGGATGKHNGFENDGLQVVDDTTNIGCNKGIINNGAALYLTSDDFNSYILNKSYIAQVIGGAKNKVRNCIYSLYFKVGDNTTCSSLPANGTTGPSAVFKVSNSRYGELVDYSITSTGSLCSTAHAGRNNSLLSSAIANNSNGTSTVALNAGGYSGSASSMSSNYIVNVSAHSVVGGGGGKQGGYIKRTVSKDTLKGAIIIKKADVGNAGKGAIWKSSAQSFVGGDGSSTKFLAIQPNITATGGAGGINDGDVVLLRNGPDDSNNKIPIVNGQNGAVITDILTTAEASSGNYVAQGGMGNIQGQFGSAQNGKNAPGGTFGAGGGGGAISFARSFTNYGKCITVDGNKTLNKCAGSNTNDGTIKSGNGGNGGGGAIIIRW